MDDDSAYDIVVARVSGDAPACEAALREVVEHTMRHHGTAAARIGIAIVNDAQMAHLNELYLHHRGATDVLAFDLRDECGAGPSGAGAPDRREAQDGAAAVEGEIVVSVDTARREAQARGHPIEAELALYAVHGVLHLLGYDDGRKPDADHMHRIEDEILSAVGWGPVYRGDAG